MARMYAAAGCGAAAKCTTRGGAREAVRVPDCLAAGAATLNFAKHLYLANIVRREFCQIYV